MVGHLLRIHDDYGTAVALGIGVDRDGVRNVVEEVDGCRVDRGRPNVGAH